MLGLVVLWSCRLFAENQSLHLAPHHDDKLRELDGATAVSIGFVDHVLDLSLSRVLAEGAHDDAELLGGDGAITVLVEGGEGVLELGNLLLGGELLAIITVSVSSSSSLPSSLSASSLASWAAKAHSLNRCASRP